MLFLKLWLGFFVFCIFAGWNASQVSHFSQGIYGISSSNESGCAAWMISVVRGVKGMW